MTSWINDRGTIARAPVLLSREPPNSEPLPHPLDPNPQTPNPNSSIFYFAIVIFFVSTKPGAWIR